MTNQSKFKKGGVYPETYALFAGKRWRVIDRWETGSATFVRMQSANRCNHAKRIASEFTARVIVSDGAENVKGQYFGRIFSKGGRA